MMNDNRIKELVVGLAVVALVGFGAVLPATADPIPVGSLVSDGTRALQGEGFGVVLPVLTLQATPDEVGGVGWNGSADYKFSDIDGTGNGSDVNLGSPHSMTYLFSTLITNGIDNAADLGLIYNANDTGQTGLNTVLHDVRLRVYELDGDWVFQTGLCSGTNPVCPGDFPVTNQGQGGDGYMFILSAPAQAAVQAYFDSPSQYRVGLWANIGQTNNGAEDFYFREVGATPGPVVPEPSTLLLFCTGIGMVGVARWKIIAGLFRK
jgi:hypothetical protein